MGYLIGSLIMAVLIVYSGIRGDIQTATMLAILYSSMIIAFEIEQLRRKIK
jgi:hypothetical protein